MRCPKSRRVPSAPLSAELGRLTLSKRLHRSLIESLPVFSAMDEVELDDIIARATSLGIPRGTAVFEQGKIAKAFYVLLNGRLKVVKVTAGG
jgi:CRP-like cAMP-binding protein